MQMMKYYFSKIIWTENLMDDIMAQYIEKSAIVAEIEKMIKEAHPNSEFSHGYLTSCEKTLSFLDTLEVKEVKVAVWSEKDEEMLDFCCNYLDDLQTAWLQSLKQRIGG